MSKRLSMRELARRAGVSVTTVSMALRDHPRIGAATRERIRALADELGYRPDPALAALNAYREERAPRRRNVTVAVAVNSAAPAARSRVYRDALAGARGGLERAGYDVLIVDAADRRAVDLRRRRVDAVLLLSRRDRDLAARLDPERVALVSIGYPDLEVPCDCVTTDDFDACWRCWEALHAAGRRRIGLLLHPHTDRNSRYRWSGAYFAVTHRAGVVPPPVCTAQEEPERVAAWIGDHGIDAVIGRKHLEDVLSRACASRGWTPGRDLAFASLSASEPDGAIGGVFHDFTLIGAHAAGLCDTRLRAGERGAPEQPRLLLIPGRWVAGASLG